MPSSFHRVWGRGIDSDKAKGAAAVVLSGGYKEKDNDDVIIYTGAGGRDKNGKQVEDRSNWQYTQKQNFVNKHAQGKGKGAKGKNYAYKRIRSFNE